MFKKKKPVQPAIFHFSKSGMLFLLAGLIIILLSHLHYLPIWASLSCFVLVMWRGLHDVQRFPMPNKFVLFVIFALIVIGVLSTYSTILGRQAGSTLLILLLCLKLFEIKSLRDISVMVQLALFAIVVSFLFSKSIFVALSMLLAVIFLIASLISFQHAKSGVKLSERAQQQHVLLASKMVLYAVPLTVLVFFIFPRISSPLWGLPEDAFQAKTGLSDQMSPGKISQLSESQAVVFRVKFNQNPPPKNLAYWRGPVFWAFDGETWSAPDSNRGAVKPMELQNRSGRIDYTVTLEPHNEFWLFALDQPVKIPEFAEFSHDRYLVSRNRINHLTRYQLTSYLNYVLPWDEWENPGRFLHVPSATAPEARKFIDDMLERYPNQPDLVNAILAHFRTQDFYYSRQPPLLLNDPIDEFLFETKRGYCEHYSSTFTILMRLAGIPARVVTGYQGGEMNPLSNYMIVRQSDAHAWSEIYLENKGWLRIDPTSVIPAENIENINDIVRLRSGLADVMDFNQQGWFSASAKQLRFVWDLANNNWNQWVIGYTDKKQKSFFSALGLAEITWVGLGYLLAFTLITFIIVIAVKMYRAQHIKKSTVEKIYHRFLNKLKAVQIEKSPSEGALSFSQRVAEKFPEQEARLISIANTYNQLRYHHANSKTINALRKAINELILSRTKRA